MAWLTDSALPALPVSKLSLDDAHQRCRSREGARLDDSAVWAQPSCVPFPLSWPP